MSVDEVCVRKKSDRYTPDELVLDEIAQPLSFSHEQEKSKDEKRNV